MKFRRRVVDGSPGEADTERSRASAAFLRVGKSDTPVSRRFAPGTGALETVIGIDDRQRVLETELHPWRMICGLELFGPTGAAIGTGWFVGPRTLLTAGHCVHDQSFFGGWADRIVVSPGRNDFDFPFGQAEATRFSALDRWVDTADPNFDIGCIHLDEDLGSSTGWFAFGTLTPEELDSHLVNISGYPGDRGSGRQQYFHANRILHVGDRRVFYDVDTFGGQSGSPVWIHEEEGAAPLAVAIHAYGTGGTPFDLGITANSAPRFIPEVFDIITEWIAEDSPAAQTG
ncbi:MAG TPA: trypsin-like peptidase domain-containing protein [Afifellaceae bacterium]|nr:trypsin-like peptidase domain-containing protein [Afifellaceae bacterium]